MRAGRPLSYEPDAALDAAMNAFWARGYDGTSMHDLLAAMGLSKSSFYQAFSGKHEVFEKSIALYCDRLAASLREKLRTADSGWDFIERVLSSAADEARTSENPRGCMIVNVATEFSARDPAVRRIIANGAQRVIRIFVAAVRQAQTEGSIPRHRDPKILGRYLMSNLTGLRTMVKAGSNHRAIDEIIRVIMLALK
jgi:TetR/AcrR family transcriptional repressor of nem operon